MEYLNEIVGRFYKNNKNNKNEKKYIDYFIKLNKRLSNQSPRNREKVITIFKSAINLHNKNNKYKMKILFDCFDKFFINGRFLNRLINYCNTDDLKDKNNKNKKRKLNIYKYYLLRYKMNKFNILYLKFSNIYQLFSKECKILIDKYYNKLFDKDIKINIPLLDRYKEKKYIKRRLNKGLHQQLVDYLRLKYIDEMILDEKIIWLSKNKENNKVLEFYKDDKSFNWHKFVEYIRNKYVYSRFISCFLSMRSYKNGKIHKHRNVLIYDRNSNSIERFEPHGLSSPTKFIERIMDKKIYNILNEYDISYHPPKSYLPTWGPQNFQTRDIKEKTYVKEGEPGRCISWSAWYIDVRLSNPNINKTILINNAINMIKKKTDFYLTNYIRNYMYRVITLENIVKIADNFIFEKFLDKYIKKSDVDNFINDFAISTFIALSMININKRNKLYINGRSFNIFNDNIKHIKDLKKSKYIYGKNIINYKDLINILKSGYIVDYFHLSNKEIETSLAIKYVGKVHKKIIDL